MRCLFNQSAKRRHREFENTAIQFDGSTAGGGKRPAVCSAGFVSRDQEQNGNKSSAWQSRRRPSWRNPHQYCSREQIEKAKASADSDRFIDHFKSIRRLGNCAKMEI